MILSLFVRRYRPWMRSHIYNHKVQWSFTMKKPYDSLEVMKLLNEMEACLKKVSAINANFQKAINDVTRKAA